jgi:mitochondrial cardiolipin hydrolase
MDNFKIRNYLVKSFEDKLLSRSERKAFKLVLEGIKLNRENLAFLISEAFQLMKEDIVENHEKNFKWLKDIVLLTLSSLDIDKSVMVDSHFGSECHDALIGLIKKTKKTMDICVYTITDDSIAREIINAKKRGVEIRIITDDDKVKSRSSDIRLFKQHDIPVKIDSKAQLMHHKFTVFDDEIVVTGSFNWTRTASTRNYENIIITNRDSAVLAFNGEFKSLWEELTFSK